MALSCDMPNSPTIPSFPVVPFRSSIKNNGNEYIIIHNDDDDKMTKGQVFYF